MKKALCVICFCLLLAACGPRLIYPNLGWLIPWYVDDYISLDRAQDNMLAQRLALRLDWHCRTQLPDYAKYLRFIRSQFAIIPPSITIEELEINNRLLTKFWRNLIAQIGPDAAEIMATATDAQIDELFTNLEKQNRKMEKKYVDPAPAEILRNRQERMAKRLRFWIQRLTPEQERAVADWSADLEPIAADWLAHRRKVQAKFRELMQYRSNTSIFEPALIDLLINPQRLRTNAYQRKIDRNTHLTLILITRLDGQLTPSQRRHLTNRLEGLARAFDQLSCDPSKPNIS